jgi:hypothetical protein
LVCRPSTASLYWPARPSELFKSNRNRFAAAVDARIASGTAEREAAIDPAE